MTRGQAGILGFGIGLVAVLALMGHWLRHPRTIPLVRVRALPELGGRVWRAWTLPPFGILLVEDQVSPELIAHELEHWRQWEERGTFAYAVDYGAQVLRYGYEQAPMEVQARAAELFSGDPLSASPSPAAHEVATA
jgi:hypothetical protein